jgi:hypothetical protein
MYYLLCENKPISPEDRYYYQTLVDGMRAYNSLLITTIRCEAQSDWYKAVLMQYNRVGSDLIIKKWKPLINKGDT